jgi:hypothetical protein
MKTFLNKYNFLLPLISSILYGLALFNLFPNFLYSFVIIIFSLYFFPVKDLMNRDNINTKEMKIKVIPIFANFCLSVLLALSIPYLYLNNLNLKQIISILGIINVILLMYFYVKDENNKRSLIHLCFIFFTSALLGIS